MKRAVVVVLVAAIQISGAGPARAATVDQMRHMTTPRIIQVVFGPAAPCFERIAHRESRFEADPPHNNAARGVFQLEPGWWTGAWGRQWAPWPWLIRRPFNPLWRIRNVLAAHWIFRHEGVRPWGSC